MRVGPVGSLVLRPKPSTIGLASPFPEGTGPAETRGFPLTERGPCESRWTPQAAKLRTSVVGGAFHCERRNGKLLALALRFPRPRRLVPESPVGPGLAGPACVCGPPPRSKLRAGAGGGAAAESPAFREKGPFAD